jgi:hypothetical protein
MAFADPQSVTISAVTTPLPRTDTGLGNSKYTSADGLIDETASSTYGKRTRRVLRIDHSKITADPFIPAQNTKVGMSHYLVFDVPVAGYTNAEVLAIYTGFKTQYTASSDLLITKLLGGES